MLLVDLPTIQNHALQVSVYRSGGRLAGTSSGQAVASSSGRFAGAVAARGCFLGGTSFFGLFKSMS